MIEVKRLTPPATSAIAVLNLRGPGVWAAMQTHFRPRHGHLPALPLAGRTWFGNLGTGAGDEVILVVLSATPIVHCEVHCHGGQQVVAQLLALFSQGEVESSEPPLVAQAPTLRTANILLNQAHGAMLRALVSLQVVSDPLPTLLRLQALVPVGKHLVQPWRVVVAGAPNVGKSTLLNALAGYQRSIVSPTPGTTRDAVVTQLAFEGWPITLVDTAGQRTTDDTIEAAGVALARRVVSQADIVLWLYDSAHPQDMIAPPTVLERPHLVVLNKIDLDQEQSAEHFCDVAISALQRMGLSELMGRIVCLLVPTVPEPDEAVPYTQDQHEGVSHLLQKVVAGDRVAYDAMLRELIELERQRLDSDHVTRGLTDVTCESALSLG